MPDLSQRFIVFINALINALQALVLVVVVVANGATNALAQQVDVKSIGFKEINQGGVVVGVWYPSDGPINRKNIGPFDVSYSDNGKPLAGPFPIVIISHGVGGRYLNHHLTASRLVRDGNVVIAPTHAHDLVVAKRAIISRMEYRQHDLTAAMVAVTTDPVLSRIIDTTVVRGVGYSLGTASIMIASGARMHTDQLEQHCADNGAVDVEFCVWIDPDFFVSVWDWLSGNEAEQLRSYAASFPLINGNITLVAPIGQGLDLRGMNLNTGNVQLLALGNDDQLIAAFHAKVLLSKIDIDKLNYTEYPIAHHYAFIAPFPKWLTDKEDIPVAKDPPGFDRAAFLTKINDDIALFMRP